MDTILLIKAGCDSHNSMTTNFEGKSVPWLLRNSDDDGGANVDPSVCYRW